MTDLASPSPETLADRRRTLRRQRRQRNLKALWRSLAVSGLAGGALWMTTQPIWVLQSADQVVLQGHHLFSEAAIHEQLGLTYPQSLLTIEPDRLAAQLEAQAPIEFAIVTRHLFPPRLEVQVQERRPVAITLPTGPGVTEGSDPAQTPGLIDALGYWMPQSSIAMVDPDFEKPTLILRGVSDSVRSQWPSLYQAIQRSTIRVDEVDWRIPSNLVLQTEFGMVHLGVYTPHQIDFQLSTLERLSSLQSADKQISIEYIDLSNPSTPAVKLREAIRPATDLEAF